MRKFLNALTKKLISGEMQLTGEKCKPSKMQTFSKGTTLHKYYCTIIGSERPNLHFVGSAEPMPNHDLSGRTDAEPMPNLNQ